MSHAVLNFLIDVRAKVRVRPVVCLPIIIVLNS